LYATRQEPHGAAIRGFYEGMLESAATLYRRGGTESRQWFAGTSIVNLLTLAAPPPPSGERAHGTTE
jgi:hypothetical protein